MTKLVHCKCESYDVLIDRTTIFGNPFIVDKNGDREIVLRKHQCWLYDWIIFEEEIQIGRFNNRVVFENLFQLKNKIIACWCKPKPCHGDILVKLVHKFYGD